MSDDERMDRARRIREMREGSRPQDEASNDDQQAEPADDGSADGEVDESTDIESDESEDDAEVTDTQDSAESTTEADDDGTKAAEDAAAAAAEAAAELSETDEGGTIHIPGADVGDVEVDVEEMARQAGLSTADGSEGGGSADGSVDPIAPGAAGRAADAETQTGEETRVLEFSLGDEQYCLDIEYVEEIVKRETVTRVPNTADCVEGVVDLRGQITTILDPKVLLDIPEEGSKSLIVVFDPDEFDDQGAVGWVVDDVNQVTPVTEDEVNPSPVDQDHVNGVVDRDGEFVIWTTPELDLDEATG